MFMRFVQLKLNPELLPEFRRRYDEVVIPAFRGITGCLYASLIQSTEHSGECISMTLWDKKESVDAYEASGTYAKMMEGVKHFLGGSSEWRVHLRQDLTMAYEEVREEPVVKAFQITAANDVHGVPAEIALFVRIVSPQLREGQEDEFQKIFNGKVVPALMTVKGCRYAYLIRSTGETTKFLSITIWESRQDAETYEQSGRFVELTNLLKHTFSEVYQWKMELQKGSKGQSVSTGDLSIEGYTVVTGSSFI
jgi:heme-degrading monooxygenase HmoA